MNRDEILNMPAGREMDVLIADNIIGWHHNPVGGDFYLREKRAYCSPCSTDIRAAWDVVDEMRKKFWIVSMAADTNLWRVEFYNPKKRHEAISEFAPLAICKAALLAVLDV